VTQTHPDVIIAGGGPAGSTIAALTKKYAPHLRVLLLEKERFPRHHIGESMLAGTTPVLKESGAFDAVDSYGFVEKLGAAYVWGKERKLWGFVFDQLIEQLQREGKSLPKEYIKAWQVRRGEYDHILLKHAQGMGAEVREGARVRRVLTDDATGRVTGVEYVDDHGAHTTNCGLFVDCTGQDALLGHALKLREYDERMNNYALYGYWKDGQWRQDYVGTPEHSRIFITTSARGWIWYIPVRKDVISVGFVTHRQTLKDDMANGPEALYLDELRDNPEMQELLNRASLVRISNDQPRDVMTIQDWSYTSRRMAGPGWAMCGDAAGFVDPILSSGAMLAQELGQKAAYTINSMFLSNSDAQIRAYWDFYQDTYRTYLRAYKDMASFWYSSNFSMESWWWQAQRTLNRTDDDAHLSQREAFFRIASGYANRAESLSLFGSYPLHEAVKLVDGLFGAPYDKGAVEARFDGHNLRLHPSARLGNGLYYWQGQVRNTRRITAPDGRRYLDLHPGEEMLVRLLDGAHTLGDLNRTADAMKSIQERMPLRSGTELVIQLDQIGALA